MLPPISHSMRRLPVRCGGSHAEGAASSLLMGLGSLRSIIMCEGRRTLGVPLYS